MKNLAGIIKNLHFMEHKNVVIDTTHCLTRFPQMILQFKDAASETSAKLQSVLTEDTLALPPRTTKTITAFVDHPSEWNTTGTVTLLDKLRKQQDCCFPIQCQK